jgi:hypothetical protein
VPEEEEEEEEEEEASPCATGLPYLLTWWIFQF